MGDDRAAARPSPGRTAHPATIAKIAAWASRSRRRARIRGTVVDPSVFGRPGALAPDGRRGGSVPTTPHVAERVRFPRASVVEQISVRGALLTAGSFAPRPPPPGGAARRAGEPVNVKSALKGYNRGSLAVDRAELLRQGSPQTDETEGNRGAFLEEYGFSEAMMKSVKSLCSETYSLMVLLDNGPDIEIEDGKCIEGVNKNCELSTSDDDEGADGRLAVDPKQYEPSVITCERLSELQDISYFLVHLAAAMAVPSTFEVFHLQKSTGGMGKGFRRVGTPDGAEKMAEDYIPLGEQAESALELVRDFSELVYPLGGASRDFLQVLQRAGERAREESAAAERRGRRILVVVVVGQDMSLLERDREALVGRLNAFAGLPATLVLLVEGRDGECLKFCDGLVAPGGGVRADVRIARSLGVMIDGAARHNPWLNYCLPVHLCQALGVGGGVLSRAASGPLSPEEVREVCDILAGEVPAPDGGNLDEFADDVNILMAGAGCTGWNPSTGEDGPLIDAVKLKRHFRKSPVGPLVAVLVCLLAIFAARYYGHLSFGD